MHTKAPEYKELAETIMFSGASITNHGAPYGFAYRKNKTLVDLRAAIQRGLRNGMGKTEFEISSIALQLEKVLKVTV